MVRKVFDGLHPSVAGSVYHLAMMIHSPREGQKPLKLFELLHHVREAERRRDKRTSYTANGRPTGKYASRQASSTPAPSEEVSETGEEAVEAPPQDAESEEEVDDFVARIAQTKMEEAQKRDNKCYSCGATDHFIRECPQRKQRAPLNRKPGVADPKKTTPARK